MLIIERGIKLQCKHLVKQMECSLFVACMVLHANYTGATYSYSCRSMGQVMPSVENITSFLICFYGFFTY